MLEREEPSAGTPGIATDAPIQRGRSAEGVEPLAPTGGVAPNLLSHQSVTFSIWLIIVRFPLAHLPKLLVC
jgi:hypothetical protein